MTLSAIFISYNGRADLERALPSLLAQDVEIPMEILVVDNGSRDDTSTWARTQPGVRLVRLETNRGYAGGVAAGIEAATGELLLQLNTDLIFAAGAVRAMLSAIDRRTRQELVSCRFLTADGGVQPYSYSAPTLLHLPAHLIGARAIATRLGLARRWSGPLRDYVATGSGGIRRVQVISGACMLYTREVVRTIGLPDARIFFGPDDWDFCARARDAGFGIALVDEPLVTHVGGATSRREHGHPYHWIFYDGWIYYHRKHGGRRAMLVLALLVLATVPVQLVRGMLRLGDAERPADVGLSMRIVRTCVAWIFRPLR